MNIISFDVGTKHLSICVLQYTLKDNRNEILYWAVKDIYRCFTCENELRVYETKQVHVKCPHCNPEEQHGDVRDDKIVLIYLLNDFLNKLYKHLEQEKIFEKQHMLIIEDQPYSTKINRDMIYVQDTILSYFSLKNIKVQPVQAKLRNMFYKNSAYKNNKKNSVLCTQKILENNKGSENVVSQLQFFQGQPKKDDYSDSFIQAICYVQKKLLDIKEANSEEHMKQILMK